jgi:hypothetical protein
VSPDIPQITRIQQEPDPDLQNDPETDFLKKAKRRERSERRMKNGRNESFKTNEDWVGNESSRRMGKWVGVRLLRNHASHVPGVRFFHFAYPIFKTILEPRFYMPSKIGLNPHFILCT